MPRPNVLSIIISLQPIPILNSLFQVFLSTFHSRSILNVVRFCFFHVNCPFSFNRRSGILHSQHFLLQFVGSAGCTLPKIIYCPLDLWKHTELLITAKFKLPLIYKKTSFKDEQHECNEENIQQFNNKRYQLFLPSI